MVSNIKRVSVFGKEDIDMPNRSLINSWSFTKKQRGGLLRGDDTCKDYPSES